MRSSISDFFSTVHKANEREEKLEEGVMLHIRARGIAASPQDKLFLSIVLSFFARVIFDPIGALNVLLREFHVVIVSAVISVSCYYFFGISVIGAFYLFLAIIVLWSSRLVASWVLGFIFDVFDIITFGLLSKLWAKLILLNSVKCKSGKISSLSAHIFTSRQLWQGVAELREEDDFFETYVRLLGDNEAINALISNYWESQGVS